LWVVGNDGSDYPGVAGSKSPKVKIGHSIVPNLETLAHRPGQTLIWNGVKQHRTSRSNEAD
jgi:uncharacterized protein YijF (DUF1287 family)